jgi:hypothetical protein
VRIRGVGGYVSRNARLGNVEATSFQTASGAAVDTAYKSPFFFSSSVLVLVTSSAAIWCASIALVHLVF